MSLTFACGHCGKVFTLEEKFAGKKGKCKQCGAVIQIPEAVPSQSASSAASREPAQTRRSSAAVEPPRNDVYGFDEPPPTPTPTALPAGIEEVEPGSPLARRLQARAGGSSRPARKPKKGTDGGAFKIVLRVAIGVALAFGGLGGVGFLLRNMAGLSSRGEMEAVFQERVNLNQGLATLLGGINDVASAQAASPQAIQKVKAITANLRKLKVTKGLNSDIEAIKQRFQLPQEQSSQQILGQVMRIAQIPGAWDALNVQAAFEELGREEQSIPGMTQVELPSAPAPALSPPPNLNPGPGPGTNRPSNNNNRPNPKQNNRKKQSRPNSDGPG